MKIKSFTHLNPWSFSFMLFGFGYVGLLVSDSSKSQQLTIPYRLLVLGIACSILLCRLLCNNKQLHTLDLHHSIIESEKQTLNHRSRLPLSRKTPHILIYIFVAAYSTKFFLDVYGNSLFYGSYTYYLSFWFLICLLPGITFSLMDWNKPWRYLLSSHVALTGLSLLMLLKISALQNTPFIAHGRFAGAALNPILLGAFSGSSILISTYVLLSSRFLMAAGFRERKVRAIIASCILSTFIGSYFLIAAASRGPIFATLICVVIAILVYANKRPIYTMCFSIVSFFFAFDVVIPFIASRGLINLRRLQSFNKDYDGSRADLINKSAELFFSSDYNFFLGYGVELPNYGYPHNIIVESFVSTGFFGGCLFLLICIVTFFRSLRLLLYFKQWGWLGLLFIFYFVLALISGSIYGSYFFWYLLFAVNALCKKLSVGSALSRSMQC